MFKSRRRGFTLAEVLVTIAIVAIIAAAVVPAVTSQIAKGEDATVVSAVGSVQSTLTTFMSDVRSFPQKLSQFTTLITTSDESLSGTPYTAAQVARWKGPYTSTSTFAVNDSLPIGLNAFLRDSLVDSLNFVVATVSNVFTTSQANRIEALFESTASLSGGTVRWRTPVTLDSVPDRSVKIFLTSSR
jgi:prepilin-type N-terminal cleavage/methylation domain-containing protein